MNSRQQETKTRSNLHLILLVRTPLDSITEPLLEIPEEFKNPEMCLRNYEISRLQQKHFITQKKHTDEGPTSSDLKDLKIEHRETR